MELSADTLYALLPAVYRQRDAQLGVAGGPGPLRELIEVVAGQFALIDASIDQLYDDAFIETCAPWVVPYIGDLIGYEGLSGESASGLSPRAEVADTIRYRRWKGTATILEQIGEDVTGWTTVAVEYFAKLAWDQFLNHVRPTALGVADIRHHALASTAGGPFDRNPHAVDVRRIRSGRGRYNIPNVGLIVWRLAAFFNADAPSDACRLGDGLYTFDPLGASRALRNVPPLNRDPFTRTRPIDAPTPLTVRGTVDFSRDDPTAPYPFTVRDADGVVIPDPAVAICDLSSWTTAAGTPTLPAGARVGVDPQRGRIWFPPASVAAAAPILVTYAYGAPGLYGAGFQARTIDGPPTLTVARDAGRLPDMTLTGAVNTAVGLSAQPIVDYADNVTDPDAGLISLDPGAVVVVRAQDRRRPVLSSPLTVKVASGAAATLVLEGLLLGQGLRVTGGGAAGLTLILRHCTVRPPNGKAAIAWKGPSGALTLDHCLTGPVQLDLETVDATVSDSLIDGAGGVALTCGMLSLARSTVLGTVATRGVTLVENAIVTQDLTCRRTQDGCVRFSWLTRSSTTSQRYRCQPDLAAEAAMDQAALDDPLLDKPALNAVGDLRAAQVIPRFTSQDPDTDAYGQLATGVAAEIAAGADDGGEMGVFHDLYVTIREADLLHRVDQNLRIALEGGVLHAD